MVKSHQRLLRRSFGRLQIADLGSIKKGSKQEDYHDSRYAALTPTSGFEAKTKIKRGNTAKKRQHIHAPILCLISHSKLLASSLFRLRFMNDLAVFVARFGKSITNHRIGQS